MMSLPKIIDNKRKKLIDVLVDSAVNKDELAIATGYWDLPGTALLAKQLRNFSKIRLLIGQNPIAPRHLSRLNINGPEVDFPEKDFSYDLENLPDTPDLRETIKVIKKLFDSGILEVKIYRGNFLHAKTYIFSNLKTNEAIGIIGSSNFTNAGLTENLELNSLESDERIITYQPKNSSDQHGHLSWFNEIWNSENAEEWNGTFRDILGRSPLGDETFGPYDMYIKTLIEVYPDELIPKEELKKDTKDVLYSFQYRNAQILINKLERMGLAMLADSVGLGKTITAGAVIKHYIEQKNATRIYVIAPASLVPQWREDLGIKYGLWNQFEVISMQDAERIKKERIYDKYKQVDLFVIDESHNLRNENSKRHLQLLDWFLSNHQSKILLLTATPVNNSLIDFVNQIQLASKGSLRSINVDYRDEKGTLRKVDFFAALKQIQGRISRAEKEGKEFDWDSIKGVVSSGLRHYLVRSTRQGIKKEGGIVLSDGTKMDFPETNVEQVGYDYDASVIDAINNIINKNLSAFENIDPRRIDIDTLIEQTQRSKHPLDILLSDGEYESEEYLDNAFANIYQCVLLLGFAPYKPETYKHKIYGHTAEEIRSLGLKSEESFKIQSQLGVHNMLRITLLKRLESSQASLRASLSNYRNRLNLFKEKLDQGYIMSAKDIERVDSEYGEDVELALKAFLSGDEEEFDIRIADPADYAIDQIHKDLERDIRILDVLEELCIALHVRDDKLIEFVNIIEQLHKQPKAGKKVLIFSYFADTIGYLKETLPNLVNIDDFEERAEFVHGSVKDVDNLAKRFAPIAKKYDLQEGETDLDYLFATDVLSEGQNLQDAGVLVNYDLHWNPVRMIQRNGRINRLGSPYKEVYIYNMKPEQNLESYLKLLRRLERKINTIKHTIGTDQNITDKNQVNAVEFIENQKLDLAIIDELGNKDNESKSDKLINTALNLYGTDATKALDKLENEVEFYSEDEYIYELRTFLAEHDEKEIGRINAIPIGKWGYMPKDSNLNNSDMVMGLAKVTGQTSITGSNINDTHFVLVETINDYQAVSLEDTEALKLLRTSPQDNNSMQDKIKADRNLVKRRLISASKVKSHATDPLFVPKKTQLETLTAFEGYLPGRNSLDLLKNRINNKQELKSIEKILRDARKDRLNHDGQILPNNIKAMDELLIHLANKVIEEHVIQDVKGMLYYAQQ